MAKSFNRSKKRFPYKTIDYRICVIKEKYRFPS